MERMLQMMAASLADLTSCWKGHTIFVSFSHSEIEGSEQLGLGMTYSFRLVTICVSLKKDYLLVLLECL